MGKLRKYKNSEFLVDDNNNAYKVLSGDLYLVGKLSNDRVVYVPEKKVDAKNFSNYSDFKINRDSIYDMIKKGLSEGQNQPVATLSNPEGSRLPRVDARDSIGNTYTKNSDGTYRRNSTKNDFRWDPSSKQFISVDRKPQQQKQGSGSGSATRTTKSPRPVDSSTTTTGSGKGAFNEVQSVKAIQEYLNSFLEENAVKQKGYSRGADGKVYDETGKEVPQDKIAEGAKNEKIKVDGKFGPETEAAMKIFNLANPDKQIKYTEVSPGRFMLTETPGGVPKGAKIDPRLEQYYNSENGTIPRYGADNPMFPLEIKQGTLTKPSQASIQSKASDGISRLNKDIFKDTQTKVSRPDYSSVFNTENLQRIGGNITDALAIAAMLQESSKPITTYEQTPEWKAYGDAVTNRMNQGFDAAVQGQFQRDLQRNRATTLGQIKSVSGGGGTQGSVLGAIGQADQSNQDAAANFAIADQAQRTQNLANFGNFARAEESTNMAMWQSIAQQEMANRSAAASAIPGLMAQIGERNQTYNSYGPGSVYEKYIESQIAKAESEKALADSQASSVNSLFGYTISPRASISANDKKLVSKNLFN